MTRIFPLPLRLLFCLLVWCATCAPWAPRSASALSPDESILDTKDSGLQELRNRFEAGIMRAGARPEDLDRGIFRWDWASYSSLDCQVTDQDRVRGRFEYWKYLDGNYRNLYSLRWRHDLGNDRATLLTTEFLDERNGYQYGGLYAGYQGTAGRDWRWAVQGGVGYDDENDLTGTLYLEALKPLSRTTLLRVSDSASGATPARYGSNTARLQLVQALHRRLAFTTDYRLYIYENADPDVNDLMSNEISTGLTWQARENLFLTSGYRYYWNDQSSAAHIPLVGARWQITRRIGAVVDYQVQFFEGGPTSNGFRLGMSLDF
jgi:hypothetical protein